MLIGLLNYWFGSTLLSTNTIQRKILYKLDSFDIQPKITDVENLHRSTAIKFHNITTLT